MKVQRDFFPGPGGTTTYEWLVQLPGFPDICIRKSIKPYQDVHVSHLERCAQSEVAEILRRHIFGGRA